ncbi:MAG: O-antigen ligase family protein [Spirochaetales bacterium]|nr:O-antigen ligase family protein [Leptospiraceae bacterium]MCP5482641.1 O-antigen ligase family protein [Spirochaetales bacterium]MCP5485022.1 O-antigen ligase family protein [Spirochaetales bacterium]
MRRYSPILTLAIAQAAGFLMLVGFTRVGFQIHRYYLLTVVALFAVGFLCCLKRPDLRYILAAICPVLPRLGSILTPLPTHAILYPWFMGLTAALAIRVARGDLFASRPIARPRVPVLTLLLLGWIIANVLRTGIDLYELQSAETLFPLRDLEAAPGVSSHYAMYLALLLGLNLFGPVLFLVSDQMYRQMPEGARETPESDVIAGFAIAGACHLGAFFLEAAGLERLSLGAGDHAESVGRLPGLVTDSGAASQLTPILGLALLLFCQNHMQTGSERARLFAKIGALLTVLTLLIVSRWLGRAYLLTLGFALLVFLFCLFWQVRTRIRFRARVLPALLAAVLVVPGTIFLLLEFVPSAARLATELQHFFSALDQEGLAAFARIDPQRAWHFGFGLQMLSEAPWTGHGLNQFQVELTRFRALQPEMLIDNPPILFLGMAVDAGLIGLLPSILLPAIMGFSQPAGRRTLWPLALALAPGMLIGYHVIFAEYCATLFFCFCLREPENGPQRIVGIAGLVLIGAWTALWWF